MTEDILGGAVTSLANALGAASQKILQVPDVDVLTSRINEAMGLLGVEVSGEQIDEEGE